VRPATALICQFIDERKEEFGVAPICRALSANGIQIAPRTYWARRVAVPGKRVLWDTAVTEILTGIYEPDENGRRPPESLYGTVKMWAHLNRQCIPVAKCTVERLKRAHGWRGVTRGRRVRTTVADPGAARAPDLVRRQFKASRPGQLHVADFTYVPLVTGRFAYTAFVVDAFAGLIPGWECSLSKQAAFVESAIRQAAEYRARQGNPITGQAIHHSDAGSQYTSVHFTETLMLAGLIPSIGTVGDALDNALAETTIGLYKTECIRDSSPFRNGPLETLADVEQITSAWVWWYNTSRLMHRLGRRPPAEAEAEYYDHHRAGHPDQAHT
jgi:transposase InsO family protein